MLARFLAVALLAGYVGAQSLGQYKADEIVARAQGPKSSATLNALLTRIGTAYKTVVIDGGVWEISADVSFPANVTVEVRPGASFNIGTGYTVTFLGGFSAGVQTVFTGTGAVAGPASGEGKFPFRIPQWGDTTSFDLGSGYAQTALTSGVAVAVATANVTNGQAVALQPGRVNVLTPRGRPYGSTNTVTFSSVGASGVGRVTYVCVAAASTNLLRVVTGGTWAGPSANFSAGSAFQVIPVAAGTFYVVY